MQDISVLLLFLISQLQDEKNTIHVLQALSSLVSFRNYKPGVLDNLKNLLEAIQKHYEPRSHLARVRHEGFNLLKTLFDNHADEIASVPEFAELFAQTFIHVATGEKDPRNLLLSFGLNTSINNKFTFDLRAENKDHDQLIADLFDVAFCYYPIHFTPPANDPYKITPAQLKSELRSTIASQTQYAQDSFPSLFEKLTSTNPAVRNDVLACVDLCIQNYTAETIELFWLTIWNALKFEVLHNDGLLFRPEADYLIPDDVQTLEDTDDNKIVFQTLICLRDLSTKLMGTATYDVFVNHGIEELGAHVQSLSDKASKQSTILLCTMSSTSSVFFDKFLHKILSFDMWGRYVRSDYEPTESTQEKEIDLTLTVSRQRDLIDSLGFLLTAAKSSPKPTAILEYKDHLLIFMGQVLQTSSILEKTLKCKVTQQLVKLITFPDLLSQEDISLVLNWLGDILSALMACPPLTVWINDVLAQEVVKGLVVLMSGEHDESARRNVAAVIDTILPKLLEKSSEPGVLDFIKQICVNSHFMEVLSIRYLSKLAYGEQSIQSVSVLIENLTACFVQTQSFQPFLADSWHRNFVPRFLHLVIRNFAKFVLIQELAATLFGYIVRFSSKGKHQSFLDLYKGFLLGDQSLDGFRTENVTASAQTSVTYLKHLLAKIDRLTKLDCAALESMKTSAAKFGEEAPDDVTRLNYLQISALLVNKFELELGTTETYLRSWMAMDQGAERIKSLELFIWYTKGLILKLNNLGRECLDFIIDELKTSDDAEWRTTLSKLFNVLMSDLTVFTNPESEKSKIISEVQNLNVKLLYKQQIFVRLSQNLISSYLATEDPARREVYLTTFAIIINNVSKKILQPHLKEILPLVLNGLGVLNASVLEASLQTFKLIIEESPELIQENVSSLLTKLISLSTQRTISEGRMINDENVRLMSLDCIAGIFSNLESSRVRRYQESTRKSLAAGLDDRKRSVRKRTTDVRHMLFELKN